MLAYYKLFKQWQEFVNHKLVFSQICLDDNNAHKGVMCMISGANSQKKL